jgi:hypothetical protein
LPFGAEPFGQLGAKKSPVFSFSTGYRVCGYPALASESLDGCRVEFKIIAGLGGIDKNFRASQSFGSKHSRGNVIVQRELGHKASIDATPVRHFASGASGAECGRRMQKRLPPFHRMYV